MPSLSKRQMEFMAPEVIRGEVMQSPKADIFSLGVMMYWLQEGKVPYNLQELVAKSDGGKSLEKRIHWSEKQQVQRNFISIESRFY